MRRLCSPLLVAIAALTSTAMGQTDRGSIRGSVLDTSGAVLPAASITATNEATGIQTATLSTEAGVYTIPNLRAGQYTVTAEKSGFKKLVQEHVKVDVAAVTTVALTMQVGDVAESVTVSEVAPQLRTETSSVATSVAPQAYNDLPLSAGGGRSPEAFIFLAPGTSGNTFDAHINGSQTLSKEIQLEGLSMQVAEVPGDPRTFTLPPNAVQEFSITTSTYAAEFGNSGGGIGQFTVKSGTNQLHGDAYEFFANDKLNARGFFQRTRPIRRDNEYGFSIGGPVYIPKLYNGKNRSFFFFNYNNYIFRSGPSNALASVPTPAFKRGDFNELREANGNLIQLFDPATTDRDAAGNPTRLPFANNTIPQSRFSTVSRNIMQLIPDPISPGIVNNFLSVSNTRQDKPFYTTKIDHQLRATHRLSGTFNYGELNDNGPVAVLPHPISSTRDGRFTQYTGRLSWDWVARPTVVNVARIGFNRQNQTLRSQEQGGGWAEKMGFRGVPNGGFISVNFGPLTSLANNQEFFTTISNTWLFSDSLSWVRDKHSFKFGVEIRPIQNNFLFPSTTGNYNFDRSGTAFPANTGPLTRANTGYAFASYLLGFVQSGGYRLSEIETGGRWKYMAVYAQDDYKLSRRVTLNLGLRWDLYLPLSDVNNYYAIMDPATPNPAAGNLPGAIIFAGEGPGRTGRKRLTNAISYNNFGPRLGLAWQITQNTVLRSGWGLGFFPQGALGGGNIRAHAPGFEGSPGFTSLDQGVTPAFLWDQGFPQNFARPPFINPAFNVGAGVNMWNNNAHEPMYRQDFNVGIQRQLARDLLLDVGWVGSKATRLNTGVFNANQLHPSRLALGDLLNRNIADPAVAAAGYSRPFPAFNGTLGQSLRPFPQYTGVGILNSANIGNSSYHSLQVKLEKRYSNGLFFLSSYTWAKSLTDASSVLGGFFSTSSRDHYNRRLEKSLAVFDVPSRLVVAMNYELPFGRGKKLASSASGVAGKLISGWQPNAILNYQSGEPILIGVANRLPLFNGKNLPNSVAGQNPLLYTGGKFDPATDRFLNIAAFSDPGLSFGTGPSVMNARVFPFLNENIGIIKRTGITETSFVEFRAEMFNMFNRVRFGGPATNISDSFNFGRVSGQANGARTIQLSLKVAF